MCGRDACIGSIRRARKETSEDEQIGFSGKMLRRARKLTPCIYSAALFGAHVTRTHSHSLSHTMSYLPLAEKKEECCRVFQIVFVAHNLFHCNCMSVFCVLCTCELVFMGTGVTWQSHSHTAGVTHAYLKHLPSHSKATSRWYLPDNSSQHNSVKLNAVRTLLMRIRYSKHHRCQRQCRSAANARNRKN